MLCYLWLVFCFPPQTRPDFSKRFCPELSMKGQVQQQETWVQKGGILQTHFTVSF